MTTLAIVPNSGLYGAVVVLALLNASPAARAGGPEQGPFAGLSGFWTGEGSVVMSNGAQERIRCRATYSVTTPQSLQQGLRCASASYVFDVKSNVAAAPDGSLSGTWSEGTRQVAGDLTGSATPGRIQTSVETLGFSANLTIATHGTRQSVSLQPQGTEVQAVKIEMRRI